jgi:spore coat protein U-like protein
MLALLALLALGCLSPRISHANVVCSITGGTYSTLAFNGSNAATGSVAFTCTSFNSPGTYSICAGLGTPSFPGTAAQPVMTGPANINFNLYTNPSYTAAWTASNPLQTSITLPAGNGVMVSGTMPYYGFIAAGQGFPAGLYTASFFNTVLGVMSGGTCQVSAGVVSGLDGTLPVTDNVTAACSVTATNVGLGVVASTATNVQGSGTITIECSPSTKYNIGLAPSNGNVNGAGAMTGSAGNSNTVPYQLYQDSAYSIIWGNTATSTSVGNGVAGHGNGHAQPYPVYVQMPSANFQADTYQDMVTITVNF